MTQETTPTKILTLASGDLWAGAEAVVYQIATGLHGNPSIQHTVVLLNHGRLEMLCSQAGIDTRVIDESMHSFPAILAKLVAICRSVRPHIIHAHRYKENLLASIAAMVCGRPRLITTVHGLSEGINKTIKGKMKSTVNQLLLRRVFDTTVAVSQDVARSLGEQAGVSAKRLMTIVNGIDLHNGLKKTRALRDTFIIGSAGRLFPVKDYPLMVDIAELTCAQRTNARFILAGDGPEEETILQKIRSCGLEDRFTLLGHVEDMQAFYAGLDLYINTSMHEGIPMTVLEAMSWRIPIVAFAVGGLNEMISHGHDGYLIQNRDAQEFSQRLIELIDDRERLDTLGENAGSTCKKFSTDQMSQNYYNVYIQALKEEPQ